MIRFARPERDSFSCLLHSLYPVLRGSQAVLLPGSCAGSRPSGAAGLSSRIGGPSPGVGKASPAVGKASPSSWKASPSFRVLSPAFRTPSPSSRKASPSFRMPSSRGGRRPDVGRPAEGHGVRAEMPGFPRGAVVATGDRTYCFIGEWDSMDSIAAARPQMIAILDRFRDTLEDLGGGLGVTDPVSGEVVAEVRPGG